MQLNATVSAAAPTTPPRLAAAELARCGDAASLAAALAETRQRTLAMLAAWRAQLGDALHIGYGETFNPLRWELGHIGWFEEWWLVRHRERQAGPRADPAATRAASIQPHADRWYNSSTVAHPTRWTLDLPDIDCIVDDVARQREATVTLLDGLPPGSHDADALYFFRLALMHEDMHGEAWSMMAQQLGLAPGDPLAHDEGPGVAPWAGDHASQRTVEGGDVELGAGPTPGFAFDNELGSSRVTLEPFTIDTAVVTWARFLPFVETGGYDDARWWTPEGRAWRHAHRSPHPRYLRRSRDGRWEQRHFDRWREVDASQPASHLSGHEARAWCRWAGRALPTEAQWCAAQRQLGSSFRWGRVWEWTASPFVPFEGFAPHPYRDYSLPWFDGRPVLKGASAWTHPHLRHPSYRNFFPSHRNDVLSGFRSVATAC